MTNENFDKLRDYPVKKLFLIGELIKITVVIYNVLQL